MEPPTREAAFQAAREARNRLGVGNESRVPDLLKLIEETGGVPVFIDRLPAGMSGAYRKREGRAYILVSASIALVRQRFTLAHEYGHHVLGHGSLVDDERTLDDYSRDPKEVQANYFAAEFLAPVRAVENWMGAHDTPEVDLEVVVRLADEFGISASAARIRLETARFLTNRRQSNELKAFIEAGEHKYWEMRLGLGELTDELWRAQQHLPRKPAPLFRKTLQAYEEGYVDLSRAAGLLEMAPHEFEKVVAERGIVPREDDDPDFSTGEEAPS
jgi:Zn-dependent peptidase ImmA (M78 family)